ncbi:MAG TPA: nuclear transport factor 2 family protein [Miltoncostaeaceae bacterium]|jgi:steroid delta-isomerase-like uncharacterized protein|nr:nuclear transport factor 2 family protein [Miltoncostaeaceae bacterium]
MGSATDAVMASFDAWRRNDHRAFAPTYAPDAVLHEHATGRTVHGGEAMAAHNLAWREVFPDIDGEMLSVSEDGGRVALQILWRGTHRGDLVLPDGTTVPATGRTIELPAAMFLVVADGLITRLDHYFNPLAMLAQLTGEGAAAPAMSA